MSFSSKLAAAVLIGGAAIACTPVDPGLGEALKYDMAIQTIDPDPVYPDDALEPGYHGEKGQRATQRYRTDRVKQPTIQTTTSSGQGQGQGQNNQSDPN